MRTSVTAEDLLVHYGSDGQAVEAVGERLPQFDVESAFTCKNKHDTGGLVVKNRIRLFEMFTQAQWSWRWREGRRRRRELPIHLTSGFNESKSPINHSSIIN